ncbi:HET-domain-containing protein, partial [Stipitochalara longipes BDJ]
MFLDWPQNDHRSKGDNALASRLAEEDPASEEAFSRAQHWIEYCKANHLNCLRNEDVPLPTRVLDVHATTNPDTIRLFVSNGQRYKYVALSHCWGNLRTCTEDTFEELQNGVSISRLPKTFQDAITVTRNLGIRYVWIDSLCIKQDSREDWSCESARMSEVYGNSFITILASSAQNSEQGFLASRDPERHILTKFCPHPCHPEIWTWIHWPWGTSGRSDHRDRKICHRAWAFQEYSLPPRVLEYAPTEMEWHCNQTMFEETMADPGDYAMHDTYKELMDISIYNRWYTLVEGYTARDLTFETDRLPAIAGIARKIQVITGDTYMAGLWGKDLGAGLCWRARGFGDLRHPSSYRAPSWSWASLEGSIT